MSTRTGEILRSQFIFKFFAFSYSLETGGLDPFFSDTFFISFLLERRGGEETSFASTYIRGINMALYRVRQI